MFKSSVRIQSTKYTAVIVCAFRKRIPSRSYKVAKEQLQRLFTSSHHHPSVDELWNKIQTTQIQRNIQSANITGLQVTVMQSKVCVCIYTFRRMREKAKERQIQLRSQFEISNISFSITFSIASIYVFSSSHSLLLILSLSLRFHQFCSHLLPPSLAHLSIYLYLCVLHTYAYI